jgi:hypothetical protein
MTTRMTAAERRQADMREHMAALDAIQRHREQAANDQKRILDRTIAALPAMGAALRQAMERHHA